MADNNKVISYFNVWSKAGGKRAGLWAGAEATEARGREKQKEKVFLLKIKQELKEVALLGSDEDFKAEIC